MFCKYCGKQLKDGEICNCQSFAGQRGNAPIQRKNVGVQEKQTGNNQGGTGFVVFSFLGIIVSVLSFLLLRIVWKDTFDEDTFMGSVYPVLIYIIPTVIGVLALVAAAVSLKDKRWLTLSVTGIMVSILCIAGIIGSMVLFPYEPDSKPAIDYEQEDTEETEDTDKKSKEETENKENTGAAAETQKGTNKAGDGSFEEIKKEYDAGKLNYIEAKKALDKLDIDKLKSEEVDELLAFQEKIESDLKEELENLASAGDYKKALEKLTELDTAAEGKDQYITDFLTRYESDYITDLDTKSKALVKEGKGEEAMKLLEEALPFITEKGTVSDMILAIQDSVESTIGDSNGDYVIAVSDSQYLSDSDIKGLTIQQINYAKNEIYARHGRKFDSKELQDYFNSKSWYQGTINPDDFKLSLLNVVEKKNAEFLNKIEFSMESGGYKLDKK